VRKERLGALLLSAAMFASLAKAAPAALPALEGKVVFTAFRDGQADLWVTDTADGSSHRLTHTSTVRELDPAWSPDATRIAFAAKPDANTSSDIWMMNEDGSGRRRLTKSFGGPIDRQPAWSPDGSSIAWTRSVPSEGASDIWVMNSGGGEKRPVLEAPAGRYAGSPAWSPDGQRIAFASDLKGGFPDIWTMKPNGSGLRRITSSPEIEGNPAWSPDGASLAFERWKGGSTKLYRVQANGQNEQLVPHGSGSAEQPAWSPDGSAIAFVRSPLGGGEKDIAAVHVGGAETWTLVAAAGADLSPDWAGGTPALRVRSPVAGLPSASGGLQTPAESLSLAAAEKQVAPGLELVGGRFKKSRFWALRFDPALATTLDVALANDRLPGRETVSSMAKRHGAVAAINGDFALASGEPIQPFAEDGDLKRTSFAFSHNFAVTEDEATLYMDHPVESVTVTEADGGDAWTVDQWNDRNPTFGEVAGYSVPGGDAARPPKRACSARLGTPGPMGMGPEGVVRTYTVEKVVCRGPRLSRAGGVVLSARPGSPGAPMVTSLAEGEQVSLTWWFHKWAGVADSLGGWPILLHDGEKRVEPCSLSICFRHPRAGVGISPSGKVLLVVVDGRRKKSLGLSLVQFAGLFRRLGAVSALNLDGGGTAEMWIRGKVVNNPSDGHERPTSSAILVLPGPDGGQSLLEPSGTAAGPGEDVGGDRAALLDPGSTGGALDAMARGLFGADLPATPEFRRQLKVFRSR
jgi:Tol biopolymer transport system component